MPMAQPHNSYADTYMPPLQYQPMPTGYAPGPSNNISIPYQFAVPHYAYVGNNSTNHKAKQNVLSDYAASQVIPGTKHGKTVGCANCAELRAENDWLRVELQAELEKLRSNVIIKFGAEVEKYGSRAMELYEKQKSEIMERERISAELKKLRCDRLESVDPQQRSMLNSL